MTTNQSRLERWEARLKKVFDEIDVELEDLYGHRARRHPNRPAHGHTSNREDDGLFDIGAAFTVGIGSQYGPGYVVQARIATLDPVPPASAKNSKPKSSAACAKNSPPPSPTPSCT